LAPKSVFYLRGRTNLIIIPAAAGENADEQSIKLDEWEVSIMIEAIFRNVAVIGTGIIGRGWVRVFAGAGCRTRLYDRDRRQLDNAQKWLEASYEADISDGLISPDEAESCRARISVHPQIEDALGEAEYVQESGPEALEVKRAIFARLDSLARPSAILASSASSLDVNEVVAGLPGVSRCLLAHPFNPPHIIPVVEVMPTKKTDPEVTAKTLAFLRSIGQKPVLVNFYLTGYLINRLQAAVVREAIHLVTRGAASVEDVDAVVSDGLGLRWALLGNFGVNNTNADGGVREYYSRYKDTYRLILEDLDPAPPAFDPEMIELIGRGVDAMSRKATVVEVCRWRDRLVRKIRDLKSGDPHP
jgi:3-hydroxyacyl-CoA dehydrogenase